MKIVMINIRKIAKIANLFVELIVYFVKTAGVLSVNMVSSLQSLTCVNQFGGKSLLIMVTS